MRTFYLGTHKPGWLERLDVPLMVSHNALQGVGRLPRARGRWVLDSGAFTEVSTHGHFRTAPRVYAAAARRYWQEIGPFDWAAIQDMMCEPVVIAGGWAGGRRFAGTGLDVATHQRRTVASLLELRGLAPELPWLPTLQGYRVEEYHDCIRRYQEAGVDLLAEPVVGLGSVCRRQATSEIAAIVASLHATGLRLHGFGVKLTGLSRYSYGLVSADSLAWSLDARRAGRPLCGQPHPRGGKTCANCPRRALLFREQILARCTGNQQLEIPWEAA